LRRSLLTTTTRSAMLLKPATT